MRPQLAAPGWKADFFQMSLKAKREPAECELAGNGLRAILSTSSGSQFRSDVERWRMICVEQGDTVRIPHSTSQSGQAYGFFLALARHAGATALLLVLGLTGVSVATRR